MIDIHTHTLPGIDDGSDSMETSLEMLSLSVESGVDTVVTTPHCNIPRGCGNYASTELQILWDRLNAERKKAGIPIRLCRGMEIFATEELPDLLTRRLVWTLNRTSYFLTEFSFDEDPDFCMRILQKCSDLGFRPIIAHPERYYFVQDDPEIAYLWCTFGYGLQINKGSLLGSFGEREQEMALALVDHGLAACVASDAHTVEFRNTYMAEVERLLTSEFGLEYATLLLDENPSRILSGKALVGYEPIPFR